MSKVDFLWEIIVHQHTFMIVWGIVEINDESSNIVLEKCPILLYPI